MVSIVCGRSCSSSSRLIRIVYDVPVWDINETL